MGIYPEYPYVMRGSFRNLAALPGLHKLCRQKIGRTLRIPEMLGIRPGVVHRIWLAAACLQELGSTPASAGSARVHNRVHKKPVCSPCVVALDNRKEVGKQAVWSHIRLCLIIPGACLFDRVSGNGNGVRVCSTLKNYGWAKS
jgi:hypothetical protein